MEKKTVQIKWQLTNALDLRIRKMAAQNGRVLWLENHSFIVHLTKFVMAVTLPLPHPKINDYQKRSNLNI
jgi:hypothetical protein